MTQFASLCQKGSDSLERLCLLVAGALLVINLASVMLGVLGRFYHAPMWTLDLAKVTLVWMVMLAAAPALKRGEHMAITILVDMLPQRFRQSIKIIRTMLFFGILALMFTLGSLYAIKMQVFTVMSLGISKSIPLLAIPIGMGLMMIEYAFQQFIPLKDDSNNSSCENIATRED